MLGWRPGPAAACNSTFAVYDGPKIRVLRAVACFLCRMADRCLLLLLAAHLASVQDDDGRFAIWHFCHDSEIWGVYLNDDMSGRGGQGPDVLGLSAKL